MTNSENGDDLSNEILNSISNEYGWLRDDSFLYFGLAVILIVAAAVILIRRR